MVKEQIVYFSEDLPKDFVNELILRGLTLHRLAYEEPDIAFAVLGKTVYIDSQEPTEVISQFYSMGYEVIRVQIKINNSRTFDMMNESKTAAAERKTVKDFISSMNDGRLFIQLAKMFYSGIRSVLVIVGEHFEYGNLQNRILGTIASITSHYNIPVVHFKTEADAAYYISRFFAKIDEPKAISSSYMPQSKEVMKESQLISMLAAIEGVGQVTSVAVARFFKTGKAIANASLEEIGQVKIGKDGKKKRKISKTNVTRIWNAFNDNFEIPEVEVVEEEPIEVASKVNEVDFETDW